MSGNRRGLTELLGGELTGRQLFRPAAVVALAFLLGTALLGLAGWFIAASAVAGLAVTSTFSFLFPSAEVQALAWGRTLARYGERILTHHATLDLVGTLQTNLFARALRLPRDRAAELRSSELLGRITVDSDAVENVLLRTCFPLIAALAALVGVAVFFAAIAPTLALIAISGLLLTGCLLVGLAHWQAGEPSRTVVTARAEARQRLIETIDGLPELRSLGAEQQAVADAAQQLERLSAGRRRIAALTGSGHSLGNLLADLTLLAIMLVASGLIGGRELSAPAFVAVCLVTIVAFEPIVGLAAATTALPKARAAAARLTDLLPDQPVPATIAGRPPITPVDLTHALTPGNTLIITGPSGSGKTTILRALASQLSAGDITMVAHDAHVFDTTIRENLMLADPAADEPTLWDALAAAALEDTVRGFPAGLDTPVGADARNLSGGQRRRLSVAQGLLRHSPVLLLDEPTEGLDHLTANRLLRGVRDYDLTTTIVVALHNRSSSTTRWPLSSRIRLDAPPRVA